MVPWYTALYKISLLFSLRRNFGVYWNFLARNRLNYLRKGPDAQKHREKSRVSDKELTVVWNKAELPDSSRTFLLESWSHFGIGKALSNKMFITMTGKNKSKVIKNSVILIKIPGKIKWQKCSKGCFYGLWELVFEHEKKSSNCNDY